MSHHIQRHYPSPKFLIPTHSKVKQLRLWYMEWTECYCPEKKSLPRADNQWTKWSCVTWGPSILWRQMLTLSSLTCFWFIKKSVSLFPEKKSFKRIFKLWVQVSHLCKQTKTIQKKVFFSYSTEVRVKNKNISWYVTANFTM